MTLSVYAITGIELTEECAMVTFVTGLVNLYALRDFSFMGMVQDHGWLGQSKIIGVDKKTKSLDIVCMPNRMTIDMKRFSPKN